MVNTQVGSQPVNVGIKSENDLLRQRIEDLTLQMGELRVHQANVANQQSEPVEDRTNIWWTNYKDQGHLKLDCPSPPALPPVCCFCGGHHDVISCKQIINPGQLKSGCQHQIYHVENDFNGNNNNNKIIIITTKVGIITGIIKIIKMTLIGIVNHHIKIIILIVLHPLAVYNLILTQKTSIMESIG